MSGQRRRAKAIRNQQTVHDLGICNGDTCPLPHDVQWVDEQVAASLVPEPMAHKRLRERHPVTFGGRAG